MKSLTLATLALAALMTGCASSDPKPYVHNPKLSEALNLAEAAGIYGLQDIPADKAYRAKGSGTGLAGAATVGALDYASPPTGFSDLGGGLMGFLSMAVPPPQGIGVSSQIVAFVPKSIAPDMDAAVRVQSERLNAALRAAREEIQLPEPFRYGEIEIKDPETNYGFLTVTLRVLGSYCDRGGLSCGFQAHVPTGGNSATAASKSRIRGGFAPQKLNGAPAWRFVSGAGLGNGDGKGGDWEDPLLPELEFYRRASAHLPPWMYLYVAPGRTSYRREDGTYAWLPAPAILRQGEVLLFIKPGSGAATAGR